MSEFEFLEAGVLYLDGILDSAVQLIGVMFAYLAASHFAGKQVNRSVAIGFSAIYSFWVMSTVFVIIQFVTTFHDIVKSL